MNITATKKSNYQRRADRIAELISQNQELLADKASLNRDIAKLNDTIRDLRNQNHRLHQCVDETAEAAGHLAEVIQHMR